MENTPAPQPEVVQPAAQPAAAVVAQKKSNKPLIIILIIVFLCICISAVVAIASVAIPSLALIPFFSSVTPVINTPNENVQNNDSNNGTDDTQPTGLDEYQNDTPDTNMDDSSLDSYTYGELPANFPSDVPVYSTQDIASTQEGGNITLVYSSTSSANDVYNAYLADLAANGWSITTKGNYGFVSTIEAKKGARKVTVGALGSETDGTVVTIELVQN